MTTEPILPPCEGIEDQVVAKLEEACVAIAGEIGISIARVKCIARSHFKQFSKKEECQQRDEQIIRLRNEGKSNREIAQAIKVVVPVAEKAVSKLIRAGRVAAVCRGRNSLSPEECQQRDEQIIRLRNEGKSNREIVQITGLSYAIVTRVASSLFKRGIIGRGGRTSCDIGSERAQLIINLKKQCATLKEIGDALGITAEGARKIINKIIAEHGAEVFVFADR